MAPISRAIRAGQAFFELFADDSRLVRGLRQAQRRLRRFGASAAQIGRQVSALGIAAATPFALSARTFSTFESQMARVQALTGAVGETFRRLEMEAKRLGSTTVFSASQAAEAMSVFALAGYDVDQILQSVGPALDLAAAGQLEIAEAADIAAKLMAGMGLEATELGGAVDIMAKAMTTANTDLQLLGQAFQYVGPIAKSAGVSFEEITAAIQLLSNAGIQGEQAGSTLRGIILALTSPSSQAADELERLGVTISDGAGNVRSLADILGDLESALSSVGTGQRLQSLGTIFPARQAAGAAELISQGADKLREATDAIGDSTGTASRIAGTQLDTLKGDFTILLSTLEAVAIAVGEAFSTELRAGLRVISQVLALSAEWVGRNQKLVASLAIAAVSLVVVGSSLVALGLGLQIVAFAVGGFTTVMATVAGILASIVSPASLVLAAVVALSAAFVDWREVVARVTTFVAERFGGLIEIVKLATGAMGAALAKGDMQAAAEVLWATLRVLWLDGSQSLRMMWYELTYDMSNALAETLSGFESLFYSGISSIIKAWDQMATFIRQTWYDVIAEVKDAFTSFVVAVQERKIELNPFTSAETKEAEKRALRAVQERIREADENNRNAARAKAERELQQRIDAVDAINGRIQDTLGEEFNVGRRERFDEFTNNINQAKADLDAARNAWIQAVDTANYEEYVTKFTEYARDDILKGLGELEAAVGERTNGVLGGFSASVIARQVGNSSQERTAKATEETAKNTKKIAERVAEPIRVA